MTISRIGTILCAVDLSEQSRTALYHAAGLSHAPGSRLVVVRVDPRPASAAAHELVTARRELEDFVDLTLPAPAGYSRQIELLVENGDPAATILATAARVGADLIVMATRGRGGIARALLGSTTASVLRAGRLPVAVVPPSRPELISLGDDRAAFHFGLILVPVDLAGNASRQLEWAGRLSGGSDHKLLVVHVVPPGSDRTTPLERLNMAVRGLDSAHGVKLLVREGVVADELVHVIHHEHAGLVVMGRSPGAPGATAYEVLRNSSAVVLTVP